MGYTHYWRRPKELQNFDKIAADVKKVVTFVTEQMGIDIGDGGGENEPEITADSICFNGSDRQRLGVWTTDENISIPWPSDTAGITEPQADPIAKKTEGHWFAGDMVSQRVAPSRDGYGSGSYETFCIDRIYQDRGEPDKTGLYFAFCKTAYRPYDLAVTAALIIFDHYTDIVISSDGEDKDWQDARVLCFNLLGYGMDFSLPD